MWWCVVESFQTSFALSPPVLPYFLLVQAFLVVTPLAHLGYEVRHDQGPALLGEELFVGFMCKDLRFSSMPHPGKAQHSISISPKSTGIANKKEKENL